MVSRMMFGEFEVSIRDHLMNNSKRIYLYKREQGTTYFVTKLGEIHAIQEGAIFDDEALMFAEMTDDQLTAFAEAMSQMGIKTNHDSIAEGKLLATERHLEDMRTIALSRYQK